MSNNSPLRNGEVIYIRSKNCKLLKDPRPDAAAITVLQPNQTVRWVATATKGFHLIQYGALNGYIWYENLSREFVKPTMSAQPFKCSVCDGRGHLTPPGLDPARWGNNFVYPVCRRCNGQGQVVPSTVFSSDGTATKA